MAGLSFRRAVTGRFACGSPASTPRPAALSRRSRDDVAANLPAIKGASEREVNGLTPQQRVAECIVQSRPLVAALGARLRRQRAKLFGQSETAIETVP